MVNLNKKREWVLLSRMWRAGGENKHIVVSIIHYKNFLKVSSNTATSKNL